MENTNYYQILGVEKTASTLEIKIAYKQLSKKHHPDKGGDQETFQEIAEAYEVLKDPEKRKIYDETGSYTKEQDKMGKMAQLIEGIFIDLIMRRHPHPLKEFKSQLKRMINEGNETIKRADMKISLLKSVKGNIRVKEGENLLSKIVEAKIDELERGKEIARNEIENIEWCAEWLANYDMKEKDLLTFSLDQPWA